MDPLVSTALALELQPCVNISDSLCGFWKSNSGLLACSELCPQPCVFSFWCALKHGRCICNVYYYMWSNLKDVQQPLIPLLSIFSSLRTINTFLSKRTCMALADKHGALRHKRARENNFSKTEWRWEDWKSLALVAIGRPPNNGVYILQLSEGMKTLNCSLHNGRNMENGDCFGNTREN